MSPDVVVLDYGSGNLRSAVRALERAGANVTLTSDFATALGSDGLVVPGVGAYAACMQGLRAVRGDQLIGRRLAGGRPVLGICVGMQVLFEYGVEHGVRTHGLGVFPGGVTRLAAERIPHMGWNTVEAGEGSGLFRGVEGERFYFVHSYAASPTGIDGFLTTASHDEPFLAAIERGPVAATQFH
ncbi:imidazole glycerol phosphate synthase subunit HisH, partial [Mumia sp.]|uniref:imidazole glycerol phosphate synthase subunit HisH n=1 Tax=Mumia sp. TaxID=1965300 RepID=UPI0026253920